MTENTGFNYNQNDQAFAIVQQPVRPQIVGPINVGPHAVTTMCPSCQQMIKTNVTHNATSKTHLTALCLCCFCCYLCCCIPYCMDSCRNANHYCPNCSAFIGTYQS